MTAEHYTGSGPRVVIVGDSLTVLAWRDLYDRLDRRYAVRIGAWVGEGFNPGKLSTGLGMKPILPHVASLYAATKPDIAVLAIGTNDAWGRRSTQKALAAMRRMVEGFHDACLVGVTLPEDSHAARWSNDEASAINRAMRTWADEIVDWATLARRPGVMRADHVHPTEAGTRRRDVEIVRAIDACAHRRGPG
jgi:lysophospholipase L1-like esterase